MKRSILLLFVVFGLTTGWAQAPYQFNFQAVARNLAGNPMTNTTVDFRLSIVQGDPDGAVVYIETQSTQTNNFGLANLLVGSGVADLGSLATLDWMAGPYFLRIELADNDGNYLLVGSSPLMSVPYALHAKTSEQAGPQGPPGEQGPQGEQGPAGNYTPGAGIIINNNEIAVDVSAWPHANQGVKIGFSSSTTWVCPAGVSEITVELWGGGGGGGGAHRSSDFGCGTLSIGGNGGNGGYIKSTVSVSVGTVYNIIVGNGGNGGGWGGGVPPTNGTSGGASSFGGAVSAPGGGGGMAGTAGNCQGANGENGAISNYTYETLGARSYIPSGFVQIIPGESAIGGNGGAVYASQTGGQAGQAGEAGFVSISY